MNVTLNSRFVAFWMIVIIMLRKWVYGHAWIWMIKVILNFSLGVARCMNVVYGEIIMWNGH